MGGLLPGQGGPAVTNGLAALKGYDLTQHDSQASYIFVSSLLFLVLLPIIMAARFFVRLKMVRALGADDVLLLFAAACACAFYAVAIRGVTLGLGKHVWDVAPIPEILDRVSKLVLTLWICNILYATALVSVKCSIIACLLRLFPQPLFRKVMLGTAAVTIAIYICSIFVGVFQCSPVVAAWQFTFKGAQCISIVHFYYPASTINMITDLILCSAPLPLLWNLQMRQSEKVILCTLFGLGYFASAAGIARLATLPKMTGIDFSSLTIQTLSWSGVEIGVGIFCAAVPALRPIFTYLFPIISRHFEGHSYSSGLTSLLSGKTLRSSTLGLPCSSNKSASPPSGKDAAFAVPVPYSKHAMREVRVRYSLAHDTEAASSPRDGPAVPAKAILRNTGIRVTHTFRQAVERSASALAISLSPPASPHRRTSLSRAFDRFRPRAGPRSPLPPGVRFAEGAPPSSLGGDSLPLPPLCTFRAQPAPASARAALAVRPAVVRDTDDFHGLPRPLPTPSTRSRASMASGILREPLDSPLLPPMPAPRVPPPLMLRRSTATERSFTALPGVPETEAQWERWGRRERWSGLGGGKKGRRIAARVREVEVEEDGVEREEAAMEKEDWCKEWRVDSVPPR